MLVIAYLFFKLEIWPSVHTKSNKWNQNVIKSLVRQKFISFLKYILYILFIYVYTKAFLLLFIKAWERTLKKELWFERIALKHVNYHMWNRLPVKVRCMRQGAQGWCPGMTQRDGMGREVGGGIGMGNTCKSMADSCHCMAKTTLIL